MFIEICLAILALAFSVLVFVLLRISSQVQQSIHLLQTDIHALSTETSHLLNTINEFVRVDLHAVSAETRQLISKLNDLSSDVNNKAHSLNFLFKPLSFLSSKLGGDLPAGESPSKSETIPQILKWVASSALLFKTTKEFIKKYGKRTR
jgi:uncharacterized protein YoxC